MSQIVLAPASRSTVIRDLPRGGEAGAGERGRMHSISARVKTDHARALGKKNAGLVRDIGFIGDDVWFAMAGS